MITTMKTTLPGLFLWQLFLRSAQVSSGVRVHPVVVERTAVAARSWRSHSLMALAIVLPPEYSYPISISRMAGISVRVCPKCAQLLRGKS